MDWECCWTREAITPQECPYIADTEEPLLANLRRRFVEKCLECPRFRTDLKKLKESEHPLANLLPHLLDEFLSQKGHIQSMLQFLDTRNREIKFLHELGVVLQTSLDLEEVLAVAMTAITAGKGFGMNRAFLLMTDKERHHLKGVIGVGPRTYEEAWRIWEEIGQSDCSLQELARNFYGTKLLSEKIKFYDILERLDVSLSDRRHIFNRALLERRPILVENAFDSPEVDRSLAEILGADSFLVIPLISKQRRIGILITDNWITHKPITPQDIQSMETFAFPLAFAIERASLYERLQQELDKVTAANLKLKEQQELIVKMEKMALVGRITSNVAHSIRNPLMVIGGFARSLLKNALPDDPKREYLESIVREAKQLEEALDEVLTYSDSLHPVMDFWDLNQLVRAALEETATALERGGINCSFDLKVELPRVYTDYKQLSYCIRNVINKAMEGLPAGGEIRIVTRQEEHHAVLEIMSQGIGTGGNARAGGSSTFFTPEEAGGMGLYLCKTMLERHGITFQLNYYNGGGIQCVMHLPTRKEAANG